MTAPSILSRVDPRTPILIGHLEPQAAANEINEWRKDGLTVRVVRGRKMRTVNALFDEMAAALQFPGYFGENWPAFDECLSDMDWLAPKSGIVLAVLDPSQVLEDAPADMSALVRSVAHAAETYAEAIERGEWWDRPAVPFHVVLLAAPRDFATALSQWEAAGAAPTELSP